MTPAVDYKKALEEAREWWNNDGQFYDPDTSDVPLIDKLPHIAQYAYLQGKQALQPCAEAMTEDDYEVACFNELENLYGKVRAEEYLIAMRCTIRALAKSGHLKVKA